MQDELFGGNPDVFEHATLIRLGEKLGIPGDEIRGTVGDRTVCGCGTRGPRRGPRTSVHGACPSPCWPIESESPGRPVLSSTPK